jgi:hypothetical protein
LTKNKAPQVGGASKTIFKQPVKNLKDYKTLLVRKDERKKEHLKIILPKMKTIKSRFSIRKSAKTKVGLIKEMR